MNFFKKIVTSSGNFFKSIKSENRKQLLELKKLEKNLENQKKEQAKT